MQHTLAGYFVKAIGKRKAVKSMKERVYIVPYVPKAEYPVLFPYEYDEEEVFRANIKELQKEIKKMGKQEYLKQRKANRKGASTAFNESFKEIRKLFSQTKKFGDTEKNPSFAARVRKKVTERPNNIGFEISASTKSINLSELMQGPVVPVPQKGIKVKARRPLKLKIGKRVVRDKRKRFVATMKTGNRYKGVYTRKANKYRNSSVKSFADRLGDKSTNSRITDKILKNMHDVMKKG